MNNQVAYIGNYKLHNDRLSMQENKPAVIIEDIRRPAFPAIKSETINTSGFHGGITLVDGFEPLDIEIDIRIIRNQAGGNMGYREYLSALTTTLNRNIILGSDISPDSNYYWVLNYNYYKTYYDVRIIDIKTVEKYRNDWVLITLVFRADFPFPHAGDWSRGTGAGDITHYKTTPQTVFVEPVIRVRGTTGSNFGIKSTSTGFNFQVDIEGKSIDTPTNILFYPARNQIVYQNTADKYYENDVIPIIIRKPGFVGADYTSLVPYVNPKTLRLQSFINADYINDGMNVETYGFNTSTVYFDFLEYYSYDWK